MLTGEEALRYSRHIKLPGFGTEGQQKLKTARVLIFGVGGLGSPAALYLAAAGVGTIALMDGDKVSLSNLQRQILHTTPDLGRAKTLSASEKLQALNPNICIETIDEMLTPANAQQTIADYDFIIDATDSLEAKYLINDTCVALGKPYSHAALLQYEGHLFSYVPGAADLRAIFGASPSEIPSGEIEKDFPQSGSVLTCSQAGVLGAAAGVLGTLQAAEAIKYITGIGQLFTNRMLTFDALTLAFREIFTTFAAK